MSNRLQHSIKKSMRSTVMVGGKISLDTWYFKQKYGLFFFCISKSVGFTLRFDMDTLKSVAFAHRKGHFTK
jgi:hypothetical protein